MKNCLLLVFVVVTVAGSLGCAQQQLGAGPGADAGCGPPGNISCFTSVGCTGSAAVAPVCTNGMWTCPPDLGTTIGCEPPICPATLKSGCTCDPATGVTSCQDAGVCAASAPDASIVTCVRGCTYNSAVSPTCDGGVWSCPAGTMDVRDCARDGGTDAEAKDAAGTCPSRQRDGGIIGCACGSDTGPEPTCVNGAWTCPPAAGPASVCTLSPPRCSGITPVGCFCNPITGVVTCHQDGGTDRTGG